MQLSDGPILCPSADAARNTSAVRLEIANDWQRIDASGAAWRELLSRSAADEPMLSPTWLLPWRRSYGRGCQPSFGYFYDGGRLIGLAPLLRRTVVYRPGLPFRRLQPPGVDFGDDCICSEYLNIIAEAGREPAVLKAFVTALAEGRFGPWDEFVLPAMNGDLDTPRLLSALLQEQGCLAECTKTDTAYYIPLPATWEEYLHALGQRRYHVKRALRDFHAWAGDDFALHEARSPAALPEGVRILKALHQERWRAAGVRGAFGRPPFDAFHDAVMPRLLEEGRLQLLWLAVRGRPVAILYNIIANGKVYFYQSGRKMDVPAGQRPGTVLFAFAIQKAIAAGLREFDFLGGVSQYKSQLAPKSRTLVCVRAVRPSLRENLRRLSRRAIDWVRGRRAGFLKPPAENTSHLISGECPS